VCCFAVLSCNGGDKSILEGLDCSQPSCTSQKAVPDEYGAIAE
jgi:hypothetical protein